MNSLLLHPSTNHQLSALSRSKPHAVLIVGKPGAGKKTLAENFICEVLGVGSIKQLAYVLSISAKENSIGIEEIRQIKSFLNRKTTGSAQKRRAILLNDAHAMTHEAQNALLKVLEEPPADTIVVLTANDLTSLRPTIRSRVQKLFIVPVDNIAASKYFEQLGYPDEAIQLAHYISDGRAGLLRALLDDSSEHELVNAINTAKNIVTMPVYDRLLLVDGLSKQKEYTRQLLMGLERVAMSGMRYAADKQNHVLVQKFYTLSSRVMAAKDMLSKNTNAKLVLTDLFMQVY